MQMYLGVFNESMLPLKSITALLFKREGEMVAGATEPRRLRTWGHS